jgi:hypothetical protein
MRDASDPKGAKITEMDAQDLVGRLVVNSHGTEFVVTRLSFEARAALVLIWVSPFDPDTCEPEGGESGLIDLDGWSVHQKLRKGAS